MRKKKLKYHNKIQISRHEFLFKFKKRNNKLSTKTTKSVVILAKSVYLKKKKNKIYFFLVILKVSFKKTGRILNKKEIMDGFLKKEKKAN